MKRIVNIISLICMLIIVMSAISYADDDFASGSYNGADWKITSDGELIIGVEGKTQKMSCSGAASYPWSGQDADGNDLSKMITAVRIEGRIRVSGDSSYLFSGLSNAVAFDLSGLDIRDADTISGMFCDCSSVESLDISSLDMSGLEDWQHETFGGSFNAAKITAPVLLYATVDLPYTMYDCHGSSYTDLPTDTIRSISLYRDKETAISAPDDVKYVISGTHCGVSWRIDQNDILIIGKSGKTQKFSDAADDSWPWAKYGKHILGIRVEGTVRAGTGLACMFEGLSNAKTIDLKGLDTSKTVNMALMFSECGVRQLDLSGFDTRNVTDMKRMFEFCRDLRKLNISGFDTSGVRYTKEMFCGCSSLNYIALGKKTVFRSASLPVAGWVRYKSLAGNSISSKYFKYLKEYTGQYAGWYKHIVKKTNPMTVSTAGKTVKYIKVRKSSVKVTPITVTDNKGTVRYSRVSGSKRLVINTRTGAITVKKGTKKGSYSVKVNVRASGTNYYLSKSRTVTVKVRVK